MKLGKESKKERIARLEVELQVANTEIARLKAELGLCHLNNPTTTPVNPWLPHGYPWKPGVSPYDYPPTTPIIWC